MCIFVCHYMHKAHIQYMYMYMYMYTHSIYMYMYMYMYIVAHSTCSQAVPVLLVFCRFLALRMIPWRAWMPGL